MSEQQPFPILATSRLQLRELRPADRDDLFAIFSREEVTQYYGIALFKKVNRSDSVLKRRIGLFHKNNGIAWGITLHNSEQLIGACQFKSWEKRPNLSEIAYEMHPKFWNKGLMTEAVSAALDYGFNVVKLNRIEAWAATENLASIKVMEKSGFQYEGTQRDKLFWNNRHYDMACYSLLRREY